MSQRAGPFPTMNCFQMSPHGPASDIRAEHAQVWRETHAINIGEIMTLKNVRKATATAALLLVGMLGGLESAQAAVYVGHWDPLFGTPFDELSWSAEAEFFIPDSCLATDGTYNGGHPCNGFSALEGNVTFSDAHGEMASETLGAQSFNLNNFVVLGGELNGVSGDFSIVTPVSSFAGGGAYSFGLELKGLSSTLLAKTPANEGAFCTEQNGGRCAESANEGVILDGGFVRVTAVPEPQTYALLLAGLGAIGFLRKKRSASR